VHAGVEQRARLGAERDRRRGAGAEALEQGLPRHAALDEVARREDALEVDGARADRAPRVVDDQRAEVVGAPERHAQRAPGDEELAEVGEAQVARELFGRAHGQGHAVRACAREQQLRAARALEVDVQLDLGVRRHDDLRFRGWTATAKASPVPGARAFSRESRRARGRRRRAGA
jgi:hypothetical protein